MGVLNGFFPHLPVLLLSFLLCSAPVFAFEVSGSLKSALHYLDGSALSDDSRWLSANAARLELKASLTAELSAELAVDQQLLWTNQASLLASSANRNRRFDLAHSWQEQQQLSGTISVDRFNLHGDQRQFSWTLGRQAIGFGRISLFSPLDVIAPFAPGAIDQDNRPGADGARFVRYFGNAGQLGGTLVLGESAAQNSYLLSAGDNIAQLDLLALAGELRGRRLFGVGLAGDLGLLGLKLESCWYDSDTVGKNGGDPRGNFAISAVEGWYRFDNGLMLLGEYLYTGYGAAEPQDYPLISVSAPLQEGLGFLLGQHYLLLDGRYELHPLVIADALLIANLADDSLMLRPQLSLSVSDNCQFNLFWNFYRGESLSVDPLTQQPLWRSEFGSYANGGGLLLRWYF